MASSRHFVCEASPARISSRCRSLPQKAQAALRRSGRASRSRTAAASRRSRAGSAASAQAGGIAARTEPSAAGRPPGFDGRRKVGAAVRVLASSGGPDPQHDALGSSPAATAAGSQVGAPRFGVAVLKPSSRTTIQPPPYTLTLVCERGFAVVFQPVTILYRAGACRETLSCRRIWRSELLRNSTW